MACGTPVITTAVSSMQDQVGDAGWLTPPGDEAALCAALDRLVQDRELRRTLTDKGLQRAAQFTWSQTARRTLEVYRQVTHST
jgi:glycosyltransferase involved in cell wall biosynthesis